MRTAGVVAGEPAIPLVAERPVTTAEALAALHARSYVSLVRLAVALVDSQPSAEEIVQQAFVNVLGRRGRLPDLDSLEAYLRRAVVNGARDRLRHRRVRRAVGLPHEVPVASAEERAVGNDEQRRLLMALAELPTRQREVLVLRYFGDLSEASTADVLDISVGTVKSTAHKGIAALRRLLESQESA